MTNGLAPPPSTSLHFALSATFKDKTVFYVLNTNNILSTNSVNG